MYNLYNRNIASDVFIIRSGAAGSGEASKSRSTGRDREIRTRPINGGRVLSNMTPRDGVRGQPAERDKAVVDDQNPIVL